MSNAKKVKKVIHFFLLLLPLLVHSPLIAGRHTSYSALSKADISSFERSCHEEINKIRREYGLKPLQEWRELANCARKHSQNMALGKCSFGHDGFEARAHEMQRQAKLLSFAENVAYSHGYNDEDLVAVAIDGWMKSEGHRKNILGDFHEMGIGIAFTKEGKFYITQLFSKPYQ